MKCLLIYTPFSKKGRFKRFILQTQKILGDKYETFDFAKTKREGHATELAKSACGVYDLILVAGGDGLLNEVIAGVAEQENAPTLAFLPAGTVNDSARSLKIPLNFKGALKVALNGTIFNTDVMKYNNKYAFYVILLGYCAKSVYSTSNFAKRLFGWFAYFFKGIKSFFTPHRMHLKIKTDNDQEIDDVFSFVLLYNSHSVAGFPVNHEAILDDGFIDVVMVKDYGKGLLNWFKNVLQVLKLFVRGAKHLKPNPHTIIRKVKTVSIQNPDKHDYNVDGSFGGENNINLTVLKQAVKIMANVKNKNKEDNK